MMDDYQKFILSRTYSRYLWDEVRREYWEETDQRYCDFTLANPLIPEKVRRKAFEKILNLDVMPSMRALWTAGPAAAESNATMYNCAALAVDRLSSFGEALYLLMCGAGVGFSVEAHHFDQLPAIKRQRQVPSEHCSVVDSRRGWKDALDMGIERWADGRDIFFDLSGLRPLGAPLKTMGGRSSGGEVLRQLLTFARETILRAQGRKLTSIECHDLMCEIASVVIVGGTRRSALMSLSDLWDESMMNCKAGEFPQRRWGSNNSAVYTSHPEMLLFMKEWYQLVASRRGERGIFNLGAARRNAPRRRKSKEIFGTNPCGEVTLRNREFCNLTEVIVRADDDFDTLRDKITTATWLGVVQSTFTDFPHLPSDWHDNCEDEHLCGVSLTGQFDNPGLLTDEVLRLLSGHAVKTARKAAKILGIPMPAAVTTVKPSGTVSQLCNCSAGLHPRWSQYYLRNVQIAKSDPLYRMMVDQGVPARDTPGASHTAILTFPQRSPDGAINRHDLTALDQLEHYLKVVENWCEHSASCTVYVEEHEWLSVANWVYEHFDRVNGLSFLPKDEAGYEWMPYQECTEAEWAKAQKAFPKIDYGRLPEYEKTDLTEGAKELACQGGGCEI